MTHHTQIWIRNELLLPDFFHYVYTVNIVIYHVIRVLSHFLQHWLVTEHDEKLFFIQL